MQHKKVLGFGVLIICAALMFGGCANTSFKKVAYIAVDTSKTLYETAGPVLSELHKAGKISDDDKAEAIKRANEFKVAWEASAAALKAYSVVDSTDNEKKLQVAFDEMQKAFKYFNAFYLALIKKE